LEIEYKPDFRQDIANSWPNSTDYSAARNDWGFNPKYGFEESVFETLKEVYQKCSEQGTVQCRLHNTETTDSLEMAK
jgi:nucleoside-diphosphate-sugar epimerase